MASWVDEHLDIVRHERAEAAQLAERARGATHRMYDKLARQMQADAERYNQRSASPLRCQFMVPVGFKLSREEYPILKILLTPDSHSTITVNGLYQRSFSLAPEQKVEDITILAGHGQDEFYYVLRGEQQTDPVEVSKLLLKDFLS